jgi:hypothetical protein
MFFIKLEENYCYIWNCHVEIFSGFVLIKMGYNKFKHHHAKHALENENHFFRFKITKKIHIVIKNSKENFIYIYIYSARRKILGFHINYDSVP